MSDIDIVNFKIDVHSNESTRIPRKLISFGSEDEISRISENIIGYSIFDSDEIGVIEESLIQMVKRAMKGKLKADSVHVSKIENKVIYQYGKGYRLGRSEKDVAKLKSSKDISPIPDWVEDHIIDKMVKLKLVPKGWIDSVEIVDYSKTGYKVPSVEPVSLFLRPSFNITLFDDSAICFGAKYYYDDEPVFSDPRFRLPSYRGIVYKFQGYASDKTNNCVRPCDTQSRVVMMCLRRTCEDAPSLRAISDGESLRNFDEDLHKRVRNRLEKMFSQKTLPFMRNFELVNDEKETEKVRERKRNQKEELSFLLKKKKRKDRSVKASELEKPQKTKDDERWKFGNSPEKIKTEWSTDEEIDRRTGKVKKKRREAKKTDDVTDIMYEYTNRRSSSREKDNEKIERDVHMKKSRKERGREFREKINQKFGFKPSIVQSDEDSGDEIAHKTDKKQKRIKAFYL